MGYWSNLMGALIGVERMGDSYFYKIWESTGFSGSPKTHRQRLELVFKNPAAIFIFTLLPDLASLGKYRLYRGDQEVDRDPLLDLLRNPNPMQTAAQFKWDYMFHRKLGTANLYVDSRLVRPQNKMYFLHGDCIEWPKRITDHQMSLILSEQSEREVREAMLKYKTNKQTLSFKYDKLLQFFDISNGISSYYDSPSRVDAIYKIIANSENVLKAKNINAEFARKFLVSGNVDISNTSKLPMGETDKQSVEDAMRHKSRTVFPTKTAVAVNRFVENPAIFQRLDEAWMNDAFAIGKMLNIPKDVIEMLGSGATYENQEKARAMIISYCIQPDMEDFCEGICRYFGYSREDYRLELDYSHLPFVQALERDRAETWESKAMAFMRLVSAGADQMQAAEVLGIEIDTFNAPVRLLGSEPGQATPATE